MLEPFLPVTHGLQRHAKKVLSRIQSLPSLFSPGPWTSLLDTRLDDLSYLITHVNVDGSHVIMKLMTSGLLTFDLQCRREDSSDNRPELMGMIRDRVERMKTHLGKVCTNVISIDCPIFRSLTPPWPYVVTGDERLLQRDFTELVHETDSQWQNIKVYKSQQCGNVLYLDDHVILGESDLVFTETLLGLETNIFTDKRILILGGGGGGLLNELVTRTKPASVTMVEIDEEVIKACRQYMRKVCGTVLDNYEGRNYKIVVGDCVMFLHDVSAEGKEYDYVINHRNKYPVNCGKQECNDDMDPTWKVISLAVKVLGPTGKYLACWKTLSAGLDNEIGKQMSNLKLDYKVTSRYVPSAQEEYHFVQAWKQLGPSLHDSLC